MTYTERSTGEKVSLLEIAKRCVSMCQANAPGDAIFRAGAATAFYREFKDDPDWESAWKQAEKELL